MEIIRNTEYDLIKALFVNTFINTSSDYYKSHIETKTLFSDGEYPTGYLWNCLKGSNCKTEHFCFEVIKGKHKPLYILWDALSCEQILTPNYWKYAKESCLKITAEEFFELYDTLPEDIYVFDDSLEWLIALTHEDDDKRRWCLSIGQ